ncbi:unnamed protein product [Clavelina lepadiformis]|uniref:Uncharacterized protein n=1 Tax=Clavelina lepadiformis TaxID=159417 RepID=A0ABP0FHY1_CLALP
MIVSSIIDIGAKLHSSSAWTLHSVLEVLGSNPGYGRKGQSWKVVNWSNDEDHHTGGRTEGPVRNGLRPGSNLEPLAPSAVSKDASYEVATANNDNLTKQFIPCKTLKLFTDDKLPSVEKLKDGKTSFSKSSWFGVFGRHPWWIPERDVIPGPVQMLEYPSMRDAEIVTIGKGD